MIGGGGSIISAAATIYERSLAKSNSKANWLNIMAIKVNPQDKPVEGAADCERGIL